MIKNQDGPNYLIITTENFAHCDPIDDFKKYKTAKGFTVEVVSVEHIYEHIKIGFHDLEGFYTKSLPSFYNTQYTITPSEHDVLKIKYKQFYEKHSKSEKDYLLKALKIRSYIKKYYFKDDRTKGAPFYVLLIGGIGHGVCGTEEKSAEEKGFIPAFYDLLFCNYPQYGNKDTRELYYATKKIEVLTDFYYANLTLDTDSPSHCWDAIVGRIPVPNPKNSEEMETIIGNLQIHIEKQKKYDKTKYRKKCLAIASDQKIFDNGKCIKTYFYNDAVNYVEQKFVKSEKSYEKSPEEIVKKLNNADPPYFSVMYRGDCITSGAWPVTLDSNPIGGFSPKSIEKLKHDVPFVAGMTTSDCWLDVYNPPFRDYEKWNTMIIKCVENLYKGKFIEGNFEPLGRFWAMPPESNDKKRSVALTFLGATRVTRTKFNQVFHEQLFKNFESGHIRDVGGLVKKTFHDTYKMLLEKENPALLVAYVDDVKMYMLLGDPSLSMPED